MPKIIFQPLMICNPPTKGKSTLLCCGSLTHITPYKLFIRLFFVEKQKLVVHPHKNVQRVFSY